MRRVMMLALLALALPTAALASSFKFDSGDFVSGTITGNLTSPFSVQVVGSTNTFLVQGVSISGSCTPTCSFSGGTLEVIPNGSTIPIFTDTLTNGTISTLTIPAPFNLVTTTISASLVPTSLIVSGTMSITAVTTTSDINNLIAGVGSVSATIVPEPGTFGLLGTGLIGLAAMVAASSRKERGLKRQLALMVVVAGVNH